MGRAVSNLEGGSGRRGTLPCLQPCAERDQGRRGPRSNCSTREQCDRRRRGRQCQPCICLKCLGCHCEMGVPGKAMCEQ